MIRVGHVSSVNQNNRTARIIFADKKDNMEKPLISGDLKITQGIGALRPGYFVLCLFLPNGRGDGFVIALIESTTVNAETPVIYMQPKETAANLNEKVTLSVGASINDGGVLSYQWYKNTVPLNIGGAEIGGATQNIYEPPTNTVGVVYYYVIVKNTNAAVNGIQTATETSNVAAVTVSE